jgi:hypothetical protein
MVRQCCYSAAPHHVVPVACNHCWQRYADSWIVHLVIAALPEHFGLETQPVVLLVV